MTAGCGGVRRGGGREGQRQQRGRVGIGLTEIGTTGGREEE